MFFKENSLLLLLFTRFPGSAFAKRKRKELETLLAGNSPSLVDNKHLNRGATLSWKPVNASSTTDKRVSISFRIAWRRSYGNTYCDQSTIDSGSLIGPSGENLLCRSGCRGTIVSMDFKCTDFSVQEDWSAGGRNYTYRFPDVYPSLYQASFQGYAWISLVTGGANWEVRMYVNLTKRNDTGLINTSPTAAMSPIVRLQYGCNHTIVIPVSDADKDDIRCRWAESRKSECAGVCRSFPGAILDERKCQMKYTATRSTGWYAVALMVEDFTDRLSSNALSGIPIQFLVHVFTSSAKCTSKPEFSGETRADGSCIGVPHGSTLKERIIAKSQGTTNRIVEIKTISPPGLTKSPLAQYSANEWYVNVTWTPSPSQVDPVIFCYTANDANGLSSDQHCVTLLAGVAPPYMVNGSNSPTGLIYPNNNRWIVNFDKEFVRPKRSRYIKIFRSDGTEVYTLDVSISNNVIYPAGSLGRTLEFRPSLKFIEKTTYYVLLDPGIVQGTKFCGPESPPMRDPSFWRVQIRDVTPPIVTFTSAPSVTSNATTITWRADEPVTSLCSVTSPTKTSVFACNDSWVGTGLAEGFYRISITATDAAGNIARPVAHSWSVDLTPPEPYLTTKPQLVSKETSSTFMFGCRRDSTCFYECSVSQDGANPTYSSCYESGFNAGNLVDNVVYVFRLKAHDGVGNQGRVLTYKWRVDTTMPTITNVKTLSVSCTSDMNPSSIGKPSVTDNEDPNPKMVYQDSPSPFGCGVQRIWTATDRAGNIATVTQTINIHGSLAPIFHYDDNIVVACQTLLTMENEIKKTINVTHPCGIPTNVSHNDSKAVMQCGSPLVRTWTARDGCGHVTRVVQTIRILALQLPGYPKNGQVNVDLNQHLNWPQYPAAVRYKVYIWKSTATKPTTPTAVTTQRVFYPSGQLPHGTKMLWQVDYIISSGQTIPSPIWGFVTRHFPDFQIDSISLPPNAFSGQTVSVSWTVRNVGGTGNTAFRWYDRIYIGRTSSMAQSRLMSTVKQERFLFPNDAYVGRTTLQLRDDDIGVFYVFVGTDAFRQIQDIDRTNNIKVSSSSMTVALTPPPNLKVESIVFPSSTFSGNAITIKWTVENQGVGITGNAQWLDWLFLSRDDVLDKNDNYLGSKWHNGFLSVRQAYTETMLVSVPHAIFGDFRIIIVTDSTNTVFENAGENDNTRASTNTLKVILSPPPDLMVSRLDVLSPTFFSGTTVTITYSVTNKGLGAPFNNWWNDQVSIMNLETRQKYILATPSYSGVFPAGNSYSRKVDFVVLPSLKTGKYGLSVLTDLHNRVFEFTYKNNNLREVNVTIVQSLPDLVVSQVQGIIISDPVETYLQVNYTIENRGRGTSYGAPWVDRVLLSTTTSFSLNSARSLGGVSRQTNLPPSASYNVTNAKFKVNREVFGAHYIFVVADAYSTILEENEGNNNGHSQVIVIPRMVPDLAIQTLDVLSGSSAYAGTSIQVTWQVKNVGSGSTLDNSWRDMLYLSKTTSLGSGAVKIYESSVRPGILPTRLYHVTAMVRTPDDMYGEYFLVIKVNGDNNLEEDDSSSNNILHTRITLSRRPKPDPQIVSVTYQYVASGNLLEVKWKAKNAGHSMTKTNTWTDRVVLSPSISSVVGSGVLFLGSRDVTAKLSSQQEYTASTTVALPKSISGPMYVQVIVNYQGRLEESSRDKDNIGHDATPVPIKKQPLPLLDVQIQTRLPANLTCDEPFSFTFKVQNIGDGDASFDSWTDSVFVHYKSDSSLQEVMDYGRRLLLRIHTGGLRVNASYTVTTSLTLSCVGVRISNVYLYAFSDMNNRIGWKASPKDFSSSIQLLSGPLPDLQGVFVNSSLQAQGGSPLKVYFNISNYGSGSTKGSWFNTLYLSQDVLKDPFDIKLASQKANVRLTTNTSVLLDVVVFIPYDTVGSEYYLLLEVDSGQLVYENNEDNNMAYVLIQIQPTARTDIVVSSVSTASMSLSLGSVFKVDWSLRNNGTQLAEGYKCDSVYLSQDEVWQIEDTEIAQPKCGFTSLLPYNNGRNRDTAFFLQKPLPIIAQGQYRGLVKSRSNIRDPFPNNNIKAGPRNINVTFPLLSLGSCVEAGSGTSVFIINNVPPEMTLIVTARINNVTSFQDLYLRHNKPASSYHYDGKSKFAMSSKQDALVTPTKKGPYYVMLQRSDQTSAPEVKSRVCAKLAKFEILNIFPTTFAALGNVTLRVEGTLFGWKLEVYLIGKEDGMTIKAKRVYRFSSTLLYATFNVQGLAEGKIFHCQITDTTKNANAVLNDSVSVTSGIPGKLTVTMNRPQAVRLLDTADITIIYQNIGDTDLPSPIIMFSANERSLLRFAQDGRQPSPYENSLDVVAQPLEGPGGILPPKSSGRLRFQAKHFPGSGTGRTKLSVRSLLDNDEPHLFMKSKIDLKPSNLSDDLWDPVWRNFLTSVGTTQKSFNRRISSVATQMSLDGRKVHMVDDLVKFQLDFANGVQSGSNLLDALDIVDLYSSSLLSLRMERTYSPILTRRRGKGIFGVGWIAPWWETSILFTNDSVINILHLREEIQLWSINPGRFEAYSSRHNIQINGDDLILNGVASDESEQLVFDIQTKRLKEIRNVDAENETIKVTAYTADNQPMRIEHSAGGSITLDFNSRGLVRKVLLIHSNGERTVGLYDYNQDASTLTSVTVDDKTTRYSYSRRKDLESVTYFNEATLRYTYNPDTGFLEKILGLTPGGKTSKAVEFQYDWDGLVSVNNLVDNSSTTFAFDENMKALSITGDDGIPFRTRTTISESTFVKSIIQGDQVVEQETSYRDKNVVDVEDANGNKVKYQLGSDGAPRNMTDSAENVFMLSYDNVTNRISESRFPDGTKESFSYDERGNLNKRTTRSGRDVFFENGADGKLIKKSVPDVGPTYYLHDSRGNIIKMTNKAGTVALRYDGNSRPIGVTYPDGRQLKYRYNNIGQRISLTESSTGYNVSYHYDRYNRLSEVYSAIGPNEAQKLLKMEYDSDGKLVRKILGNNGSSEYTYEPGTKRLKKMVNIYPFGNLSSSFEYGYDDRGRPVKITSKDGIRLFKYDAASQLIGWTDVMNNGSRRTHAYEYDSRGNRVYSTNGDNRENYGTNNVNQYMSAGDNEFAYDKNGNMLSKKNPKMRVKDVKYVFSEENVLLQTETVDERCDYVYDSLGNLYKKKCTSGETRYLIDPFGHFGSNVIAQISDGLQPTLFVHSDKEGLLARMDENGTAAYYDFNGEGNVVGIVDHTGKVLNSYRYGPFGIVLNIKESVPNDFLFVGQWGVMRERGIPYLYRMRARHYDAEIGRFLSYDPLGYRTLSTNLYHYAYNNPISLQDPQGRFPAILVGTGLGAALGVGSYLVGQWVTGEDITLGGVVSAGFTGAVTGTIGAVATLGGLSAATSALLVAPYAWSSNMIGYMMKQGIDDKPINQKEMLIDSAIGTVTPNIKIKARFSKYVKKAKVKDFIDNLFGGSVTNSAVNGAKKYWEDITDPEKIKKKLKEMFDDYMDWMQSLDPNDILGPTGFGDARYIAEDTLLDYKIRFENDPNATAPAQRVVIKYQLDQDLDPRTFKIGSFGFGNFTKEQAPSPFLQEKLDFSDDRNLLVRVTAGIDVVQNEATWDLQTLDPKTGEPPRDPRRGFLPPNNGTTGQGYVTFSVRVKSGVEPLTRIDAQASIIFDRNEAIDTPPIFNTIDNSKPNTNLTVLQDLLKKGSLAVVLDKEDIGTGVRSVDIYYQEVQGGLRMDNISSFKQLIDDVTDDTVILPLAAGKSYKIVTSSVDHVGNKQELQNGRSIFVDFPEIKSSCSHFNNCSGHGNCSIFSVCVCEEGYYGLDCSRDEPPLEPPVLEASSSGGIEDTPIPVFLSTYMVGVNTTNNVTLSITIYGVPDSFEFSRGMRSKDQVKLSQGEFGELFVTTQKDFSGNFTIDIVAQAKRDSDQIQTTSSLTIIVRAKADLPTLITEDACANSTRKVPLPIQAWINDSDGSEKLTIALSGLPNEYQLSRQGRVVNGTHYLESDSLTGLFAWSKGDFEPFLLKVVATSVEKSNGDRASVMDMINITRCSRKFTCEKVKNCSGNGICVGPDLCRCEKGYTGQDCSEDSTVNPSPEKDKILAVILGAAIGGVAFLLLIIVLVVIISRAHKNTTNTNANRMQENVFYNRAYEDVQF